jgi:DNA-directed RNA polymerase alpha subunit
MKLSVEFNSLEEMVDFCDKTRLVKLPHRLTIKDLEFTVRTENCLLSDGIDTVLKLTQQTELHLKCIPNLGRKSLNEIRVVLAERGLTLALDDNDA